MSFQIFRSSWNLGIFLTLSFLFVLSVGGVGYMIYKKSTTLQSTDPLIVLYEKLEKNKAFVAGNKALVRGEYQEAHAYFKQVEQSTTDLDEAGYVQYLIGLSNPDVVQGIKDLKMVVTGNGYSKLARAYAVGAIGSRSFFETNEMLSGEVFVDPPYSFFFEKKNRAIAFRRLAEYASSFYPTPESEFSIAYWYARDLYKLNKENLGSASRHNAKKENLRTSIREHLANGVILVQYPEELSAPYNAIAWEALLIRVQTLAVLKLALENGFDDPEPLFNTLIEEANLSVSLRARFYYAVYLDDFYGDSKQREVVSLLTPLFEEKSKVFVEPFLTKGINDSTGIKQDIVRLASLDVRLKKVLFQLGWKVSDFE